MTRPCLDILRHAPGPLTNREIAVVFMEARKMDTGDAKRVELIAKRVGRCMRGQRAAGWVASEVGQDQAVVWRLT